MNEDSKKYTTEASMLLKTKDRVSGTAQNEPETISKHTQNKPLLCGFGENAVLTQACGAAMNEDSKKYTTEASMLLKTKDQASRNV